MKNKKPTHNKGYEIIDALRDSNAS